MKVITVDNISVNVVKSARRKTMALKVHNNQASIHIPTKLPIKLADEFVRQKIYWIKDKLEQQSAFQRPQLQFEAGESLHFLGNIYQLSLIPCNSRLSISITDEQIICSGKETQLTAEKIRNTLVKWYREQATHYLKTRTMEWASSTGLVISDITVKSYKARWGSCSISGAIQFNWKLIMAPQSVIDYVIIHELCHTVHHNHSRQFWLLVAHFYPDYKQARLWLKQHGPSLDI